MTITSSNATVENAGNIRLQCMITHAHQVLLILDDSSHAPCKNLRSFCEEMLCLQELNMFETSSDAFVSYLLAEILNTHLSKSCAN